MFQGLLNDRVENRVHSTYSWPGFPEVYLSLEVSKSKCKDMSVGSLWSVEACCPAQFQYKS